MSNIKENKVCIFSNIIQPLSEGFDIQDLLEMGFSQKDIDAFLKTLMDKNLTIENAVALNAYSNHSNIILSIKRNTASKENVFNAIIEDLKESLSARNIDSSNANNISSFIQNLNYTIPLYKNYQFAKDKLKQLNLPKICYASVNSAVQRLHILSNIDKIEREIEDALEKSKLEESIVLYRAVKLKNKTSLEKTIDQNSHNSAFTSTSPNYSSSFAKYDDFDIVFKIHAPKGTKGIDITPFSDYDTTEQEILIYSNDIDVSEVNTNFIDENGKKKTLVTGIIYTREKSYIADIEKE